MRGMIVTSPLTGWMIGEFTTPLMLGSAIAK
jgi:hypothetical protein